jgi:purine nucleosidase
VPSEITHSPVLTDELTWSVDNTRHLIRNAVFVRRNPIFEDLFRKLDSYAG